MQTTGEEDGDARESRAQAGDGGSERPGTRVERPGTRVQQRRSAEQSRRLPRPKLLPCNQTYIRE